MADSCFCQNNTGMRHSQKGFGACPPSLLKLFSLRESNLVDRESRQRRDYAQKASARLFRISDFLVFFFNPHSAIYNPQFGGGPIGRPYIGITLFLRQELLARPTQKAKAASRGRVSSTWFLRVTPLFPGRATPEIQSIFRLLGEK